MSSQTEFRQKIDLMITAGCVITVDRDRRVIRDGAVAVSGKNIIAVGKITDIYARYDARSILQFPFGVLTPGLVDVHSHPIDYLIRGIVDDLPQIVRLRDIIFPYEDKITEEEAYAASVGTINDMIRLGTTTFMDAGGTQPAAIARAIKDTGIRGTITRKTIDLAGPFGGKVEDPNEAIDLLDELFERFHGKADGRLRTCYNLDTADTVSERLTERIRDHAREREVGIVCHFLQRRPEGDISGFRNSEVARFAHLDLLAPDVTLVHVGWLPQADVEQLGAAGSSIAHCPGTSLFGAAGWVSHGVIPELVAAGANVALGTDAIIVNRFVDMLRVMYLTSAAHRDARRQPDLLPAPQVLEMATLGGARAMGLEDRIGSIEIGKAADLVVFDATNWRPSRYQHPVNDLVFSGAGSKVELVVVDGKVVHQSGEYVYDFDIEGVLGTLDVHAETCYRRLGRFPTPQWPVT